MSVYHWDFTESRCGPITAVVATDTSAETVMRSSTMSIATVIPHFMVRRKPSRWLVLMAVDRRRRYAVPEYPVYRMSWISFLTNAGVELCLRSSQRLIGITVGAMINGGSGTAAYLYHPSIIRSSN
jgi:hypothetical protein